MCRALMLPAWSVPGMFVFGETCLPAFVINLLPHPYASYLPQGHAVFEADWYLKHWEH